MPRDCRTVATWIWGIPGVHWGRGVGGGFLCRAPCGSVQEVPCSPGSGKAGALEARPGTRLCQEEGSPLSRGDPTQEGRAAGGADWTRDGSGLAGAEGGLEVPIGPEETVWGARSRAKGKTWGCLGVQSQRESWSPVPGGGWEEAEEGRGRGVIAPLQPSWLAAWLKRRR